jgi:hypothetical protein
MYTIFSENKSWFVFYCNQDNTIKEKIAGPFETYLEAFVVFDSYTDTYVPLNHYKEELS